MSIYGCLRLCAPVLISCRHGSFLPHEPNCCCVLKQQYTQEQGAQTINGIASKIDKRNAQNRQEVERILAVMLKVGNLSHETPDTPNICQAQLGSDCHLDAHGNCNVPHTFELVGMGVGGDKIRTFKKNELQHHAVCMYVCMPPFEK